MNITEAKWIKDSEGKTSVVQITINSKKVFVPYNSPDNRHTLALKAWIEKGNKIKDAE